MSARARLAAFGALLAAVFAGAILVGGVAGPDVDASSGEPAEPEHGGGHAPATDRPSAPAVRGLAVADGGHALQLDQRELPRGARTRLSFRIAGDDGRPLTRFDVEHEERMHLIVVRRDGRGFQHLHPVMARDGSWSTAISLPDAGAYRVFADYATGGRPNTLAADLTVDGAADYRALPEPRTTSDAGRYQVRLDANALRAGRPAELAFEVLDGGRPVHTEPYLGVGGHLVALREGDLAYLHTHPADHGGEAEGHDDAAPFETEFPSAGRYRLYFQFKAEGRVHTAEFTQEVKR